MLTIVRKKYIVVLVFLVLNGCFFAMIFNWFDIKSSPPNNNISRSNDGIKKNDITSYPWTFALLSAILAKGSIQSELPTSGIPKQPEVTYDIPKYIHLIWVFSEIPDKYINNVLRLHELNVEYTVYLWLDTVSFENKTLVSYLNRERLILKNVKSLNLLSPKLAEDARKRRRRAVLSDLLRFEIVYSYGGIYTDTDTVALKPYPIDVFTKSFVTYTLGYNNLNSATFGMPKGSSFLRFIIHFIQLKTYSKYDPSVLNTAGPPVLTTAYVDYSDSKINCIPQKYLIAPRVKESITYHTMDATWTKPEVKKS